MSSSHWKSNLNILVDTRINLHWANSVTQMCHTRSPSLVDMYKTETGTMDASFNEKPDWTWNTDSTCFQLRTHFNVWIKMFDLPESVIFPMLAPHLANTYMDVQDRCYGETCDPSNSVTPAPLGWLKEASNNYVHPIDCVSSPYTQW